MDEACPLHPPKGSHKLPGAPRLAPPGGMTGAPSTLWDLWPLLGSQVTSHCAAMTRAATPGRHGQARGRVHQPGSPSAWSPPPSLKLLHSPEPCAGGLLVARGPCLLMSPRKAQDQPASLPPPQPELSQCLSGRAPWAWPAPPLVFLFCKTKQKSTKDTITPIIRNEGVQRFI